MDTGLRDYSPGVGHRCRDLRRGGRAGLAQAPNWRVCGQIDPVIASSAVLPLFVELNEGPEQKVCALQQAAEDHVRQLLFPPESGFRRGFGGTSTIFGIYKEYLGLKYGRCLGHSAVPVLEEQEPYETLNAIGALPQVAKDTSLPLVGNVYAHGFAMLALGANGQAKVDYFNGGVDEPFLSETIGSSVRDLLDASEGGGFSPAYRISKSAGIGVWILRSRRLEFSFNGVLERFRDVAESDRHPMDFVGPVVLAEPPPRTSTT